MGKRRWHTACYGERSVSTHGMTDYRNGIGLEKSCKFPAGEKPVDRRPDVPWPVDQILNRTLEGVVVPVVERVLGHADNKAMGCQVMSKRPVY